MASIEETNYVCKFLCVAYNYQMQAYLKKGNRPLSFKSVFEVLVQILALKQIHKILFEQTRVPIFLWSSLLAEVFMW